MNIFQRGRYTTNQDSKSHFLTVKSNDVEVNNWFFGVVGQHVSLLIPIVFESAMLVGFPIIT